MNRRLHELELELRRLENEREELAAAYKEAEAVSNHLCLYNMNIILNKMILVIIKLLAVFIIF